MEKATSKLDLSGLWEGYYYLGFYVFFILFILPNMPKALALNYYYPVAMILYGGAGLVTGMVVFRFVRNKPGWLKWAIIAAIYLLIIFQLITHFDRFLVPAK